MRQDVGGNCVTAPTCLAVLANVGRRGVRHLFCSDRDITNLNRSHYATW